MPAPHKHAALIKAWADGAQIEVQNSSGSWTLLDGPGGESQPGWYEDFEYRIKPANPLMVSILNGIATLPNGERVSLLAVQHVLCCALTQHGETNLAVAANELSRLTGKFMSNHGDWVDNDSTT